MKSTKCKRPPNNSDVEDVTPRRASLRLCSLELPRLYSVKRLRVAPTDEIVPECGSEPKQKHSLRIWRLIKQRLRDVLGQLRALLFIPVEDERVCLRLRGFLQFHQQSVSWMALQQSRRPLTHSLPVLLQDLDKCVPKSKTEELKLLETMFVLSALLAHILGSDITQYRPLLEKLSKKSQLAMGRILGEEYTRELSCGGSLQDRPGFESWFSVRKREPQVKIERSLLDLREFPHVQEWSVNQEDHDAKRDAFERNATRKADMSAVEARLKNLEIEQKKTKWKESEKRALDHLFQDIKKEEKHLKTEEKLMLLRTRKYRLFPTREQEKTLKQYMGTCRWTYNQAVAHFRKTNEFNAKHLRDLYVTKTTQKTLEYPEDMSPPPEWTFDTPKNLRYNTLLTFQTNVASAFSNLKNGNISKFKIRFSNKKRSPFFTMSEDGKDATIKKTKLAYFLSISCLKDIRVKMNSHVQINNEIDILNSNGFWYVAEEAAKNIIQLGCKVKYCIELDYGLHGLVEPDVVKYQIPDWAKENPIINKPPKAPSPGKTSAPRPPPSYVNDGLKCHYRYHPYIMYLDFSIDEPIDTDTHCKNLHDAMSARPGTQLVRVSEDTVTTSRIFADLLQKKSAKGEESVPAKDAYSLKRMLGVATAMKKRSLVTNGLSCYAETGNLAPFNVQLGLEFYYAFLGDADHVKCLTTPLGGGGWTSTCEKWSMVPVADPTLSHGKLFTSNRKCLSDDTNGGVVLDDADDAMVDCGMFKYDLPGREFTSTQLAITKDDDPRAAMIEKFITSSLYFDNFSKCLARDGRVVPVATGLCWKLRISYYNFPSQRRGLRDQETGPSAGEKAGDVDDAGTGDCAAFDFTDLDDEEPTYD